MYALAIMLGPRRYLLRPGTKVRRLENRIVTAMRRGGGVVRLPLVGADEVDAVVTPALPVFVERLLVDRNAAAASAEPVVDWPRMEVGQG